MKQRQRGQAAIQAVGMMILFLVTGAFAVDTGIYFAESSSMRNATDAAALAAANALFKDGSTTAATRLANARTAAKNTVGQSRNYQLNDSDITFGYVNPATGIYNANTFSTTNASFSETGGYNAARVVLKRNSSALNAKVPSLFAKYFGWNGLDAELSAVAIYGGSVNSFSGLRPIYVCQNIWNQAKSLYGDPTSVEITLQLKQNGSSVATVGTTDLTSAQACGNLPPGSFGLADFTNINGAPGASTVRGWWDSGYSGTVSSGQTYEVQPGSSFNSYRTEIEALRSNGTVFTVPLYTTSTGNGSNARFAVSGFAGFKITEHSLTGNNKYIKGRFQKTVCHSECALSSTPVGGGAVTKLRMVN